MVPYIWYLYGSRTAEWGSTSTWWKAHPWCQSLRGFQYVSGSEILWGSHHQSEPRINSGWWCNFTILKNDGVKVNGVGMTSHIYMKWKIKNVWNIWKHQPELIFKVLTITSRWETHFHPEYGSTDFWDISMWDLVACFFKVTTLTWTAIRMKSSVQNCLFHLGFLAIPRVFRVSQRWNEYSASATPFFYSGATCFNAVNPINQKKQACTVTVHDWTLNHV